MKNKNNKYLEFVKKIFTSINELLNKVSEVKNPTEAILGGLILIIAAWFAFSSYSTAGIKKVNGYNLYASFSNVGGITKGSEVQISGIKVGSVLDIKFDNETFLAKITVGIKDEVKIPIDSSISITSSSLMGDKHIKIEPGNSINAFEPESEITNVKDYKSLEDTVSEIMFLVTQ